MNRIMTAPSPARPAALTAQFALLILLTGVGMFPASGVHAQTVYRIVGPDGRVTFSDKPPATSTSSANVTATTAGGKPVELSNTSLPFELRQVANRYPVTLYTSANCGPCGSGRSLLTGRGVPFTERTVSTNEDNEALMRISGENSLPFVTIGGQKIKGFSDTEWTQFLDAAGYPQTSRLPGNYRNPAPAPLVAVQKPTATPATAQAEATPGNTARAPGSEPAAQVDNSSNPAGIKF